MDGGGRSVTRASINDPEIDLHLRIEIQPKDPRLMGSGIGNVCRFDFRVKIYSRL